MSRSARQPPVLFRVACGARQGFGHLVRAMRLADALGVPRYLSVRGSRRATDAAVTLGARLAPKTSGAERMRGIRLVVVDDPSERHALVTIRRCRAAGVPVASVHDLGLGADGADVVIDGSILTPRAWSSPIQLLGTRYAILDPRLGRHPEAATERRRLSVLIALGGGPRGRAAERLALDLVRRAGDIDVTIAAGFMPATRNGPGRGVRWLCGSSRFLGALRRADVVVSGGGVTLYECCASGRPAIGVSVVPAQRPTIQAFARAGAVVDGGALPLTATRTGELAGLVLDVLANRRARRRRSAIGRSLVDGQGIGRVCAVLRPFVDGRTAGTSRRRGAPER